MSRITIGRTLFILVLSLLIWMPVALEMTIERQLPAVSDQLLSYFQYGLILSSPAIIIVLGYILKGHYMNATLAFIMGSIILAINYVVDINQNVEGGWNNYGQSPKSMATFFIALILSYSVLYHLGSYFGRKYH